MAQLNREFILLLEDNTDVETPTAASRFPSQAGLVPSFSPALQTSVQATIGHTWNLSSAEQIDEHSMECPTFVEPDWNSDRRSGAAYRDSFTAESPLTARYPRSSILAIKVSPPFLDLQGIVSPSFRSTKLGTISTPIEIDDDEDSVCEQLVDMELAKGKDISSLLDGARIHGDIHGVESRQSVICLDDENSADENTPFARNMKRALAGNDILIDLDDVASLEEVAEDCLGGVRGSNAEPALLPLRTSDRCGSPGQPRQSGVYELRNPAVAKPFISVKKVDRDQLGLRVGRAVELLDGDFLHITDILLNHETNAVKLRGHRLQRSRDLNGMLSKKLNELCFFYEIDLDDERPIEVQSAVEIDIAEVLRVRSLHITNMPFPLDRATDSNHYMTMAEASANGGLTVRWKYTCKYASAAERLRNNPQERMLEHISVSDCPSPTISASARRFNWRGETVRGGLYQPETEAAKRVMPRDFHYRSHISIDSECLEVEDRASFSASAQVAANSEALGSAARVVKRKDRCSIQSIRSSASNLDQGLKRTRRKGEFGDDCECQSFPAIDWNQSASQLEAKHVDLTGSTTLYLAKTIDLTAPDVTTPPQSGFVLFSKPLAPIRRNPGQKLTYGDAFCGAGGATRGAVLAGLKVEWGFDFWAEACKTWTTNFPDARNYNMFADAFIQEARSAAKRGNPDLMKVDILHLSPPCQFFSTAHTVNGVNDEMNTASLFAVEAAIEVARPRIVTLEQTFGIAMGKFRYYLNALIMMFTSHGFSVRWSTVQLADWGVPQRRKRLIIIASCPGEVLPQMPAATHNEHGTNDLKPYSTVNQALLSIPHSAPDHNPDSVISRSNKSWNGDGILPRTMTTSGGQNYHPSGTRDFTNREFATLQGFPVDHVFMGTGVKKQIGNAVPPCVARVLFESIKRDLDMVDGILEDMGDDGVVVID